MSPPLSLPRSAHFEALLVLIGMLDDALGQPTTLKPTAPRADYW